jgi:hypothetical protein
VAAVLGWLIILALLALASAAVLWPASLVLRRLKPEVQLPRWGYLVALVVCGVVIWFVFPLVASCLIHAFGLRLA